MAQFKNFLKHLEIREGKAVAVLGGAKTKTIDDTALKPPRAIKPGKNSIKNPRDIPSNKTHSKSVKGTGASKRVLDVTGTKPTSPGGPEPKRTNNSEVDSHASGANFSSKSKDPKDIEGGSKVPATRKATKLTLIGKKSPKNPGIKVSKHKSTNKLLKFFSKGNGHAKEKGFIHPPLSKTAGAKAK